MKAILRNHAVVLAACALALVMLVVAIAYPDSAHDGSPAMSDVQVSAKPSLDEYSWDELAAISSEIARCGTETEAIACANRYGLCAADGSLAGAAPKLVQLANGQQVPAILIGIGKDARTDGGKAGLTFMFAQPVGEHAMNHAFENAEGDNPDSVGGWGASDMRAWLNGDFLYELPADLRSRIVNVQKQSAGSADTGDESDEPGRLAGAGSDWTAQTSDKVWLLSASELCGKIPENRGLGVDATMAAVYATEGGQYRLFADWGVSAFAPNTSLAKTLQPAVSADLPCTWWLRTKTLEFGSGFWLVGTDGTPLNGLGEDARVATDPTYAPSELWGPDHARAVLPCFCV